MIERLYALLLHAYPRKFRLRFGEEMRQSFRAELLTAETARHRAAVLRRLAGDWLVTCIRERMAAMDLKLLVATIAAVAASVFTGYVDFHNKEVQAPMLVLLVSTFCLGAVLPRYAWIWATVIGLSIAGESIVCRTLGLSAAYNGPSSAGSQLFVLIPAFFGAYCGALLRRAIA
jgi:hypothetical protein